MEIFVLAATTCLVNPVGAEILNVNIFPEVPTMFDEITIITSGAESQGGVLIDSTNFNREGTLLRLDIFLVVGDLAVFTPWSHPENIGTLPAGMYDLTVQTFENTDITDAYSMSFEVTPEPSTLILLLLGFTQILRRKSHNPTSADKSQ
jgi:hypothetical protein